MSPLKYRQSPPPAALTPFVESFWALSTTAGAPREVIVLPDGRIDLLLSCAEALPFHLTLLGLGTRAQAAPMAAGTRIFAVSFRPLAAEYLLRQSVAPLLDDGQNLPAGFLGFTEAVMEDFDAFCRRASAVLEDQLSEAADPRKLALFEHIFASQGSLSVGELSGKVFWSSRQMNRYFNQQYGLPLKTYCDILRFRAAFPQLRAGRLFPEQDFADQAHFIREVKKFSGALPKDLHRNRNGRFIQFSALSPGGGEKF